MIGAVHLQMGVIYVSDKNQGFGKKTYLLKCGACIKNMRLYRHKLRGVV